MKTRLLAAVRVALLLVLVVAGAMAGGALVMLTRPAEASRDASGNYTLPAGNPIALGSKSSSTLYNSTNSDIATELQDSLSRSAKGAMLAQLKLFDGTVGTPGLGWGSETGTGWRRAAAGDVRFGVSGVDKLFFNATGMGIGGAPTLPLEIVQSGSASTVLSQFLEGSLADGNFVQTYLGKQVGTGTTGVATYTKNATAANSTYCLAVFGASASTLCVDGNGKTTTAGSLTTSGVLTAATGINISAGVGNDQSGFKHQSVAGCTTAASVGATCPSTLAWTTPFADASYHAVCGCNGSTGVPVVTSWSVAAGSVSINTAALTASAATCTNISCVAVHN
jgi:hypothetical protein